MRTRAALILIVLMLPSLASAAAFGFPREPLWVSSKSGTAGETITMYVALYNSSESEMKGEVTYRADGATFDTKQVSLAPGNSSLVSSGWKAAKGTHALSAQFASGATTDTTQKITVTIADAPEAPAAPPTLVNQTLGTATDLVQTVAASSSPVGKIAGAVIGATEKVRTAAANLVRPYAADPKPPANLVSGPTKFTATKASSGSLVNKGSQLAASALLYAFDTKWLFYVLAIVLFYLIIRTLKRWVNRPRF